MFLTKIKKISRLVYILPLLAVLIIAGCENNPTGLGLNFVSPDDTLGTLILDTTIVTGNNFKKNVSPYGSVSMLIGNQSVTGGQYTSKSLLRFLGVPSAFQGATVLSASLKLVYNKYAFKDTNGVTAFNIYKLNRNVNFQGATIDSVPPSDIGSVSYANFTGTPTSSSQAINVTLDNQLIKDWIEYAADTNYAVKNYGLAIVPMGSSNTIKGFYNELFADSLQPKITVTLRFPTRDTTITIGSPSTLTLSDAPLSVAPTPGYFTIQNGIAFRNQMKLSFPNLPANVIINEAYLELKINSAASFLTAFTDPRIKVEQITDSTTLATTEFDDGFYMTRVDSITYQVRINKIVQRWNQSINPNYGIMMFCPSEIQNLDNFVFYGSDNPNVDMRPKFRVKYTVRD